MYPEVPTLDWRKVDRAIGLPSDDHLRRIADEINANKKPDQGRPGIVEDHRLIGLAGERAFARTFRIPMDLRKLKYGTYRTNFVLTNGFRVDVVTRRPWSNQKEPNLSVPVNTRARVDVWVLMIWMGWNLEPIFRGWIPEGMARRHGWIQQFHEKGVPNLCVNAHWLAPISGLMALHRPNDPMAVALPDDWWATQAAEIELLREARKEAKAEEKKALKTPQDQLKLW